MTDVEVFIDTVHPFGVFDTVILFDGEVVATGERVTVAADHRPARGILEEKPLAPDPRM